MGWTGRILRVNLTQGRCESEPLNLEWAEQFLGQRGLASKYLMESMDSALDPLDPGNVLIFATGPLTATMAPTAGRYCVVTKGALTNAIACSNSGRKVGAGNQARRLGHGDHRGCLSPPGLAVDQR